MHPPCVSSRAHHPALYSALGHMQRCAYMRALAHVYMRNVAYAHSTSLTRSRSDTLVRTCTHAHAHSKTDRITHTDGIPQERHTQTHTCTHVRTHVRTQTVAYIHTYISYTPTNHETSQIFTNTHADVRACAPAHTHTLKRTRAHHAYGYAMGAPAVHTLAYIHTYTHEHTQTHKRTCAHSNICTNIYTNIYTTTYMPTHTVAHTNTQR